MKLLEFARVKLLPTTAKSALRALALCSILFSYPAFAQRADVPEFDKDGNFRSTRVQGNRGFYQQLYWLVVDRDPNGLNCRKFTPNDNPEVSLSYGAVIKTDIYGRDDDAISIRNGQTWLRVQVIEGFHYDHRTTGRNEPYSCIVRANASFIAPINNDDFRDDEVKRVDSKFVF